MTERTGFTTPNLMEAETNRAFVDCAQRLVVIADHTKWGLRGLSSIVPLADADTVVCDRGISSEARDVLQNNVRSLVVVDSIASSNVYLRR